MDGPDPIVKAWADMNGRPEGITLIKTDVDPSAADYRLAMARGEASVSFLVTGEMQAEMFMGRNMAWYAIRLLNRLYSRLLDVEANVGVQGWMPNP